MEMKILMILRTGTAKIGVN